MQYVIFEIEDSKFFTSTICSIVTVDRVNFAYLKGQILMLKLELRPNQIIYSAIEIRDLKVPISIHSPIFQVKSILFIYKIEIWILEPISKLDQKPDRVLERNQQTKKLLLKQIFLIHVSFHLFHRRRVLVVGNLTPNNEDEGGVLTFLRSELLRGEL